LVNVNYPSRSLIPVPEICPIFFDDFCTYDEKKDESKGVARQQKGSCGRRGGVM